MMNRPPKSKAIERLENVKKEIPKLKAMQRFSPGFKKWRRNCLIAIENTFGYEGRHVKEFSNIRYMLPVYTSSTPDIRHQQTYVNGLESVDASLESMIEEIEEHWEDEEKVQDASSPRKDVQIDSKRVFLVHGRDEGPKHEVARFITKLGLEPVILDEQADRGRTIIAKFKEEAQEVGFAVVLLTPDDEGRLRDSDIELIPRARQNVIFELGYFAGALGRKYVCAMTKGDVEIPSDYDGVVYIPLDNSGGWKLSLVKELKAAGFDVDANLAL